MYVVFLIDRMTDHYKNLFRWRLLKTTFVRAGKRYFHSNNVLIPANAIILALLIALEEIVQEYRHRSCLPLRKRILQALTVVILGLTDTWR